MIINDVFNKMLTEIFTITVDATNGSKINLLNYQRDILKIGPRRCPRITINTAIWRNFMPNRRYWISYSQLKSYYLKQQLEVKLLRCRSWQLSTVHMLLCRNPFKHFFVKCKIHQQKEFIVRHVDNLYLLKCNGFQVPFKLCKIHVALGFSFHRYIVNY